MGILNSGQILVKHEDLCRGLQNHLISGNSPPFLSIFVVFLRKTVTSIGGILVPPVFGMVSDASNLDLAGYGASGAALCTLLWTVLMVRDVSKEAPAAPNEETSQSEQISVSLANNPSPA